MNCASCQKEIAQGSNFCYYCGAKQAAAPAQQTQARAQTASCPRRLMRSSTDKKIGGVCAGVANYLDLDPTLVRVLWALAFLCGGFGLIFYIVLWIVLPVEPLYAPVAVQTPTP